MQKTNHAFSLIELSIVILIIGILVAGVTQGSRLVTQIRVNSAKTQTQSSPVNSIKDLTLWLEPTMYLGITSPTNGNDPDTTDIVSSWNDLNPQTATKNNATQSTNASRPSYVSNGINNLPSLKFDGVDDNLILSNIFSQSFTVFAVIKTSVAGTNGPAYAGQPVLWGDRQLSGYDGIPMAVSGGVIKTFNGTTESTLGGTTTVSDNNAHVAVATRNMTSGARTLYVDGVSNGSDSSGAAGIVLNDAPTILIGGDSIDGRYYQDYIAEIIAFDRVLKNEERKAVESYLGKKWGIKVS